jgi:hypothetical protein
LLFIYFYICVLGTYCTSDIVAVRVKKVSICSGTGVESLKLEKDGKTVGKQEFMKSIRTTDEVRNEGRACLTTR